MERNRFPAVKRERYQVLDFYSENYKNPHPDPEMTAVGIQACKAVNEFYSQKFKNIFQPVIDFNIRLFEPEWFECSVYQFVTSVAGIRNQVHVPLAETPPNRINTRKFS